MTIIVTGGTKGIGLGVAEQLARPGEALVLGYVADEAAAEAAKARLAPTGAVVTTVRADVGEIEGAAALMEKMNATPTEKEAIAATNITSSGNILEVRFATSDDQFASLLNSQLFQSVIH